MATQAIRKYANNISTKLTAQLLAAGTTANVTAGDGASFAAANGTDFIFATLRKMSGYAETAREIVKITNRSTDALTIVRAQEGTTALQFEIGDRLDIDFTTRSFTVDLIVPGTTTNDDAPASYVGEYVSSTIAAGSAVALTTNTAANVTAISLTAGDWDVWLELYYTPGATTVVTYAVASISQTSATTDATVGAYAAQVYAAGTVPNGTFTVTTPPVRKSLGVFSTIYGVAYSSFTTSTNVVFGILRARRVR